MPYVCCVVGCNGNYKTGPKVHLFKFPNDKNLLETWVAVINRLDFWPTKHSRVCELHFPREKILRTTTATDSRTGYSITANLKIPRLAPDAVPTLFPELSAGTAREGRGKQRRERSEASVQVDSRTRDGVVAERRDMDCETLIGEVYARRQLWDMLHPHHHHRGVLDRTWREISNTMGISVKDARQKWKYLRDQFRRELRKFPKGSAEKDGVTYEPTWPYFSTLYFLKDQMMLKKRDDSPSSQSSQSFQSCSVKVENDFEEVDNELPSLDEEEQIIKAYSVNPLKRSGSNSKIQSSKLLKLELQEESSDDYHFFMSLLPTMSKFNDLQKMRLRSKFQHAIVEELSQMEEYQGVASSSNANTS